MSFGDAAGASWSFALQMMQRMAELSVDLDVVVCNAALSACGSA